MALTENLLYWSSLPYLYKDEPEADRVSEKNFK